MNGYGVSVIVLFTEFLLGGVLYIKAKREEDIHVRGRKVFITNIIWWITFVPMFAVLLLFFPPNQWLQIGGFVFSALGNLVVACGGVYMRKKSKSLPILAIGTITFVLGSAWTFVMSIAAVAVLIV